MNVLFGRCKFACCIYKNAFKRFTPLVVLLTFFAFTALYTFHWSAVLTHQGSISTNLIKSLQLRLTQLENRTGWKKSVHAISKNNTASREGGTSPILNSLPQKCTFPEQDPFHPSIPQRFTLFPTLDCSSGVPSLVYVEGNWLKLNTTKAKLYNITTDFCQLVILRRKQNDDYSLEEIKPRIFKTLIQLPNNQSHFLAVCYSHNVSVSRTYISVIRENNETEERRERDYRRHVKENHPKETLSVLLVGIDSMSRQNFIRSMNKTRQFLLNSLKAIELYKFNKVGDNTYPNVVPLLSGWSKSEIMDRWPEPLWRQMDNIDHLFLWTDYQKAGYRTAMTLDMSNVTAFHYLKKGWNNPTFDYYNRPVVLKSEGDSQMRNKSVHCVGETTEISFLFDNWLQLTSIFNNTKTKPYFGYSFVVRLTHDTPVKASAGDDLYLRFFQSLHSRRVLNNTLLIFFSDHGPRFGAIRKTVHGLLESRTPFAYLIFPEWFESKYPQVMDTLRTNQHRLTTMFDLHATLKDLLYFQGTTRNGSLESRGISLFHKIPEERMCHHAGIPRQFCMCLNMTDVVDSPELTQELASVLLTNIVNMTDKDRDKCLKLSLSTVDMVTKVTEVTRSMEDRVTTYQVIIQTKPNDAIYEGTLEYDSVSKDTRVVGTPIRLNLYRGQAQCMKSESLRPFCYCKTGKN